MIDEGTDWLAEHGNDRIRLRPAAASDVDEIVRIIRLHDTGDARAARETFDTWEFGEPDERGAYFVALVPSDDDADLDGDLRVVGVSGYAIDSGEARGVYWLGWTYVNPFFQGEGIGSCLLDLVLDALCRADARRLYVSTSSDDAYTDAVAFYRRHGFSREATLEDYYRPGEDRLIFARSIDG